MLPEKAERDENGAWSWQKKLEVATKYNELGNMRLVSELTGVPYSCLVEWKRSDWWPTLIEEVRKQKQLAKVKKMGDIVDRSLEILQDRLENGDQIYDPKSQEIKRVPISMRDASKTATEILDKQIKLEEMANRVEVQRETVQETLKLMATEFSKWTKRQSTKDAETIEYKELTDAIHEER